MGQFDDEKGWESTVQQAWEPTPMRTAANLSWMLDGKQRTARVVGRAVIGSSEEADITLADPTVSRVHCEIEISDDGAWLNDLGSLNGCHVEAIRVGRALVPDGATIRLGDTTLALQYDVQARPVVLHPEPLLGRLVGSSVAMRELFAWIEKAATFDSPILVQGETGTGKELVAECLHEKSKRKSGPFVVVDCGALPPTLIDSELFGHTKGAFTGATFAQDGLLVSAHGGTLVLDEIGELPLSLQPRLLRALESKRVRPLGARSYVDIDVSVVALTHRNLIQEVVNGSFREDLYFRLAGLPLRIPPLRERREDIPLLVRAFVGDQHPEQIIRGIVEAAQNLAGPWNGNVRELRRFVERALAFGVEAANALPGPSASMSGSAEGFPAPDPDVPFKTQRQTWCEQLERSYLELQVERVGRSLNRIAEISGLDRSYVYRLLQKHGL